MPKSQMDIQLREAGQLTGADWAACMEYSNEWELLGSYKMGLNQRSELQKLIMIPGITTWMKGVLAGYRNRPRIIPEHIGLTGRILFIFPNQVTQRIILVAAENLSVAARRFWQSVALGHSATFIDDQAAAPVSLDIDLVSYHLPRALDRILEIILRTAEGQGGWLAVRSGDYLEIKTHSNGSEYLEKRLSINGNSLLREIIQSRKTRIVTKKDPDWASIPRLGFGASAQVWIALPLIIGKRLIGLVAVWGKNPFSPGDMEKLNLLAERIASSVEGSVTFTDLTNHLHRLAYLNDFAVTVFSSQDLEQIVQRTFGLLRRGFNTNRINLMVQFPDGAGIQNYFDHNGTIVSETIVNRSFPSVVRKDHIYRTDLITPDSSYKPIYSGSKSALVTAIKYRKQMIGALGLESENEGIFTVNDEHLLAVIACYIAGFLENGRLRQEAEAKARNLRLIHEVVEQVIGQTDVRQLAQVAAELIARNFDYDHVGVALVRGPKKVLQLAGIGGRVTGEVSYSLKSLDKPKENGIAKRVATTGKSALVNDFRNDSAHLSSPGWKTGSEMCVALKEGEQSFGVIDVKSKRKNSFSQNDLLMLESLGGILASVISNVGQYQKLQMTVKQLRATQEELQEHISAQQMAERRLVQAAKLAAVGEMAAGIAHELNNPLTTVIGFTELTMEEVQADSRVHADLELVLREAHRATDVVRRLLDFARQSESVRMRSDINDIVKEVLALVNHLLHTSGVQLITNFPIGLPSISVDKNQIKQVVLNLIHNALHAMPKGGELRITTDRRSRDHQDWVTVVVSDTGVGISPENLERIFEPFFTTRAKEGGTGLGPFHFIWDCCRTWRFH